MRNYDKEIAKILGRKRISLISDCGDIYFLFNPGEDDFPLDDLIYGLIQDEKRLEAAEKSKNEVKKSDWPGEVTWDLAHVAFTIGYIFGLFLEPGRSWDKKKIERIKKFIRENNTLVFHPSKKAA